MSDHNRNRQETDESSQCDAERNQQEVTDQLNADRDQQQAATDYRFDADRDQPTADRDQPTADHDQPTAEQSQRQRQRQTHTNNQQVHNQDHEKSYTKLSTALTRGEGTRDQDKTKLKTRNPDPVEAVKNHFLALDRGQELITQLRAIQPADETALSVQAADSADVDYIVAEIRKIPGVDSVSK